MLPSRKILFLLLISLIPKVFLLQCGEEQIDHCETCATDPTEIGTCAKCEDGYFPFLFNYLCLPCDHMTYGDYGCKGNCKIDNNLGFICDEFGCKEGFYSIDKISCESCNSLSSPNCAKCSYLPPPNFKAGETDERIFNCSECINDKYKIFPNGRCQHCYKPYCEQCHFQEGTLNSVCDKCMYDYYLRGEDCVKCPHYGIYGGYCRKCTDNSNDLDNIFCHCNITYYQNSNHSCADCPTGCWSCSYDEQLKGPRCYSCKSGYVLNKRGTCSYCGRGCSYCSLDKNENPLCIFCFGGYKLMNQKCYACPTNCERCHLEDEEEENGNFICDKCFYHSSMNSEKQCIHCPSNCYTCEYNSNGIQECTSCYSKSAVKNGQCVACPNIPELGPGCEYCSYDRTGNRYKCYSCINRNYANVTNSYECKPNTDPNNKQLYGCFIGHYNNDTGKYECKICKSDFIPIINDKNCRRPSEANLNSLCREAINIGTESEPIYSCISCQKFFNTNVTDQRGASDCYSSTGALNLCEKATKDINGNINCTKCFGNFQFIWSNTYNKKVCNEKCEADGFKKGFWCYKCEDKDFGNPGCVGEKGCTYLSANDQLNCNECKVGYFQYTHGQCFQCKEGDKHCVECHMNNTADAFECDK